MGNILIPLHSLDPAIPDSTQDEHEFLLTRTALEGINSNHRHSQG